MADHPSPETKATPENHARAQIFDKLPDAVFALAESNKALSARVEKLARINSVLIAIVIAALCGVGVIGLTWARDVITRLERVEGICLPAKKEEAP